ncbi:hypothetical protein GCM10009737_15250 [Nocardioides lentus]|uniref:Serine-type D-Ala-D-Ala carboxypeptidase n=1 Tax=Nocardioides lentus TaxID=338077 RepID=A0ABN2P8X8_9ACTN
MLRGDLRHTEAGAVRLRPVLVVVVVLGVLAAGLLVWRPGLVDDVRDAFTSSPAPPDPDDDPADVDPPSGLDLPAVPAPPPVAAPREPADTGVPDAAAVRRALAGPLRDRDLGGRVVVGVSGLATDRGDRPVLLGAREAAVPASTTKVMTAAAALEALGPERRFATRVVDGGTRGGVAEVVLVGGGDPLLASAPDPDRPLGEPARADLRTLAEDTAETLRADGTRRVRVAWDDTLFDGPPASPTWEDDYLSSGVVSPVSALWADRGVRPDEVRAPDPARAAAGTFAAALREAGVRTPGAPRAATAPTGATELARVTGLPVDLLVEHLLETSDNEVGEVLAHQVGLAVAGEGSFRGGSRGVTATLRDLGVGLAGVRLNDGSGLSRANRLTATALLDVLDLAAAPDRPELRSVLTGLPVAGFSGSLTNRFATVDPAGLGAVRGKTGTLTGVSGLAGVVTTADGAVLSYAVLADRIDPVDTLGAIQAVDRLVAALAACRCAA